MEIDTRVEGHGDAMAKVAEISLQAKECQQLTALTSCPVKTFVAKPTAQNSVSLGHLTLVSPNSSGSSVLPSLS